MIPQRSDVTPDNAWDLSALYDGDGAWNGDLDRLKTLEPRIAAFSGRLGEGIATIREFIELWIETGLLQERLGYYAMLRQSEDAGDSDNQARFARFMQVSSKIDTAESFFAPELQQLDETLRAQIVKDKSLAEYRIALEKILRFKEHVLSPREERLLAMQSEANQTASKTFGALVDVDIDFGEVETPEGVRPLSQSSYGSLMEHRDRSVRKTAFDRFFAQFDQHKNTLAGLYEGSIHLDIYQARARNYPSALEMRLFPDKVPVTVYDTLVSTVRENVPVLHRYYRLRARALGLDRLSLIDTKVSLVPDVTVDIPYDTSVDMVVRALQPLGDEYTSVLRKGLLGGWVDRYENKGKRSGAFSAGSYQGEPYILMNYKDDTIRDTFTLAHEAGHSMHSWYSVRNNPFQHYGYTIFEAEVASTFNEQLLFHDLLARDPDTNMRAYLVNKSVDDMIGTLFRQTMFAEYERILHERVEAGEPLTVDSFREIYRGLLEDYFGTDVDLPPVADLEGLRIPHFYRAFYVYKYATGIAAAIALSQMVLEGGESERERYFAFLKSGGSRYPLESLAAAGVDMSRPQPIQNAMALFRERVEMLENLLERPDQ